MSTTALTIRTDTQTKQQISDFAASVGLSTSGFMLAAAMQAVREQRIQLTPALQPTPYLQNAMRKAQADRRAGRNIHGPFASAADMIADLER